MQSFSHDNFQIQKSFWKVLWKGLKYRIIWRIFMQTDVSCSYFYNLQVWIKHWHLGKKCLHRNYVKGGEKISIKWSNKQDYCAFLVLLSFVCNNSRTNMTFIFIVGYIIRRDHFLVLFLFFFLSSSWFIGLQIGYIILKMPK